MLFIKLTQHNKVEFARVTLIDCSDVNLTSSDPVTVGHQTFIIVVIHGS